MGDTIANAMMAAASKKDDAKWESFTPISGGLKHQFSQFMTLPVLQYTLLPRNYVHLQDDFVIIVFFSRFLYPNYFFLPICILFVLMY